MKMEHLDYGQILTNMDSFLNSNEYVERNGQDLVTGWVLEEDYFIYPQII